MEAVTTHDFNLSLEVSHSLSKEKWWESVYRKKFPNFLAMTEHSEFGWWQLAGIDRVITLRNTKSIYIDEKVRLKEYDDILLEIYSDKDRKKPGWVEKDLFCDYIAYAMPHKTVCYFLPFLELRNVWRRFGHQWKQEFGTIEARNKSYITESVPVPVLDLFEAFQSSLIVNWSRL